MFYSSQTAITLYLQKKILFGFKNFVSLQNSAQIPKVYSLHETDHDRLLWMSDCTKHLSEIGKFHSHLIYALNSQIMSS